MLKITNKIDCTEVENTISKQIPNYVALPYEVFSNKLKLEVQEYEFLILLYGMDQDELDIKDLYQNLEDRYSVDEIHIMIKNLTERGYLDYDWSLDKIIWNGNY